MYESQGYSYPERAYHPAQAAAPGPGLEGVINSAIVAFGLPRISPGNYATHSYEARKQEAYAAISSVSLQQPYLAAPTTAAEEGKPSRGIIYHAQPVSFLNPLRPRSAFIAGASEISQFIREAFLATTGQELPSDISIMVASRAALQQIHRQFMNPSVVGLSLNSNREIFAVAGSLDDVMLVVGHELGHVLSPPLQNSHAEEAKAFAFEMAWASAIFANDVAGLSQSISQAALEMKPAQNGLHDAAFAFVKSQTSSGKEPLELHSQIVWNGGIDFEDAEYNPTNAAATPITYVPLISSSHPGYHSGGYRNTSNVQNVPWMNNFSWADLGTGVYGMYLPMTASIFMNEKLLRNNLEQFHKTLGHEYILHHVMQLPDNYVTKILEDTIFWVKDDNDKSKP